MFLLALAVFWPVTRCDFVDYDDLSMTRLNPDVKGGLTYAGIHAVFRHGMGGFPMPVALISLMADVSIWGTGHAFGFHLTNLLLHCLNVALLLWLLASATGSLWRATVVTAIFAVHPLRVESVAWIADRKGLLASTFALLMLMAWLRYAGQGSLWAYLLSLPLLALSLLAKPLALPVPFVLLLVDVWPLQRWKARPRQWKNLLLEKLGPLAVVVAMLVYTSLAAEQTSAFYFHRYPPSVRLCNALTAIPQYLARLVWFDALAIPYPMAREPQWLEALASLLLVVAISGWSLWQARRRPWIAVGWFAFLAMIGPTLGLVTLGAFAMADRYTYPATFALSVAIIWSITQQWWINLKSRTVLLLTLGAALAALIGFTERQITYWQNAETLFGHAVAVTKDNDIAEEAYADTLGQGGRLDEAMPHFFVALRLHPDWPRAYYDAGRACYRAGDNPDAVVFLQRAVAQYPPYSTAWLQLALALDRHGDREGALNTLGHALRTADNPGPIRVAISGLLTEMGRYAEAEKVARGFLRQAPNDTRGQLALAAALAGQGRVAEALDCARAALSQGIGSSDTALRRAIECLQKSQAANAVDHLCEAIRVGSDTSGPAYGAASR